MEEFIQQVAPSITVAVLLGLGGVLWKLILILKPLEEFMKTTKETLVEHEDRLDIQDQAWTLKTRRSFNSKMISKGQMDLPEV